MKELVGEYIAQRVKDGDVLGLGSGSTAEAAIRKIGARIKNEKLKVKALVTSYKSLSLALDLGFDVLPLSSGARPTFGFDGADEVDPELRLIKGQGAALTREKLLSRRTGGIVIIVTEEKLVKRLGEKMPVPVEVLPDAIPDVTAKLAELNATSTMLREGSGKFGPVVTEHGNFLLDAVFPDIPNDFEERIKGVPGVIESGIFTKDAAEVIVAKEGKLYSFKKGGSLASL